MRAPGIVVCCLLGALGCGKGQSTAFVTVRGQATAVDHFDVTVSNGGQSASSTIALNGRPVSLPPDRTFSIVFPADRSGDITVTIDVLDAANHLLTSGKG